MNFFPPPARVFSQATHSSSSSSSSSSTGSGGGGTSGSGGNGSRSRKKTNPGGTSLRHTLSLTGNRDRDSRTRGGATSTGTGTPNASQPGTPAEAADANAVTRISTTTGSSGDRSSHPAKHHAFLQMTSKPSSGSSVSSSSGSPVPPKNVPLPASKGPSPPSSNMPSPNLPSTPSGNYQGMKRLARASTLPTAAPSGRTGSNLPKGLNFDWVRPEEVKQCHSLENVAYESDDVASKERMQYRQEHAPHLFLAAYIPVAPPKVAGPLSVGYNSTPRKIIGYVNGTASSSLSARAIGKHTRPNDENGEEAWLVCVHSVVVDEAYRHVGLGLRMLEEYMMRLRRAEEGRGEKRQGKVEGAKGYECVALLCHEETLPFFLKAGFKIVGPSHVRAGSGEWIEMRRYIHSSQQKQADEKKRVQQEVEEQERQEKQRQREQRRVVSAAAAASNPRPSHVDTSSSNQVMGKDWQTTASPTSEHSGARSRSVSAALNAEGGSGSSAGGATNKGGSISGADDKSDKGGGGLAGFSQADILAALSASTPSYKPGTNPSQPFSSILGQTLAGKTFVEDAFIALEARLVDRGSSSSSDRESEGSNLMEIWCPREECGCKLVARGMAMWELAESGPLSQPELEELHLPSNSASLPPTPQPPPAPASHLRALVERQDGSSARSTLPGAPPSAECLTPIRPFWSLCSAMSFDNIGFSQDVQWQMPSSSAGSGSNAGHGGGGLTSSPTGSGDEGAGAPDTRSATAASSSTSSTAQQKRKPTMPSVRRPTFLSHVSGKNSRPVSPGTGRSGAPIALSSISGPIGGVGDPTGKETKGHKAHKESDGGQHQHRGTAPGASATGEGGGPSLTVKYLLCPNCDTGPLGYTIVPERLTGGQMGAEVGAAMNPAEDRRQAPKEIQVFMLAAERVRYRMIK